MLEFRSSKCIFLEYKSCVKGYKLWCTVSRDVVFDELTVAHGLPHGDSSKAEEYNHSTKMELKISSGKQLQASEQSTSVQSSLELANGNTFPNLITQLQYSITKDRHHKQIKPLQKYGETDLVTYALSVANSIDCTKEPVTYLEAINYSDSNRWLIVMQEKIE